MSKKKTIMICDDNEIDILKRFQGALSEDYEILTADSEEDGIDESTLTKIN